MIESKLFLAIDQEGRISFTELSKKNMEWLKAKSKVDIKETQGLILKEIKPTTDNLIELEDLVYRLKKKTRMLEAVESP